MRKFLLSVLIFTLALLNIFAWQDNYRQSSDEVQTFYMLRTLSGTSTIEPVYPISGSQLLNLVKQLDCSKFIGKAAVLYDDLVTKLEHPSIWFKLDNGGLNADLPVLVGETNSMFDPFFHRITDIDSLLNIKSTIFFSEYFTGEFDFGFDAENFKDRFDTKFFSVFTDFEVNQQAAAPNRAYGSFGYDKYNLTVGKDRVSEGMGISGNLALAENFYSEDYVKASYQGNTISYDFTWIDYDDTSRDEINFQGKTKQVIQHRVSAKILERVSISVSEGALIYTADIFNDPKTLNPFMFMHNWGSYYSGNTNNWFELELSGQLPRGIEINSEVFLDQIKLSNEYDYSGETAFGILVNAKKVWSFQDSVLKAYAEAVYNNDCCYLRGKDIGYGYDLVDYKDNDLYVQLSDVDHLYNLAPIGYIYGTDIKAFVAGISFNKNGQTLFADGMYIIDGPNGGYDNENRDLSNTTNTFVQKTVKIDAGLKGTIFNAVSYKLKLNLGMYENLNHTDEDKSFVPQYEISFVVDPLKLIEKFRKTL